MADQAEQAQNGKQEIEVAVTAPRSAEPKEFTWDKHLLVSEAAQEAATAFGYTSGQPSLLLGGEQLDGTKQLVAAGVRTGETLQLLDTGGGV